ncbi:SDR family NAD(P)-dependent oxidoreductase [Novipirellula artificiosorum]|uniref:Putative ketoacyl reductase n=1 Tax=Novipirellula artificiosorum TaxID=2528016 RepID=A0A5C6DWI5_9BACT|nr:SDR family NAD(P)-dependent oxidoreductase [Novipirellula artificiosorum]TWU39771.1 putative ketoacyl reductase [Novipirellula artificiosorum]
MDFENKVALVTGAAGSIGKGIASHLIAEGAQVFVTDLDQSTLDTIVSELGENCQGLAADVTVHDQVKHVVDATTNAYGKIDVLINVAGVTGKGAAIEDVDEKTWEFVFDVNCKGTFLFIKEVVPLMKATGSGSIVNFSSKSGKTGSALMSAYSSAKAAIIGLTQALAFELAGNNIRVNCVCPGITEATGVWSNVSSDYVKNMNMPHDEIVKMFTSKVPLGRLAKIDDVVQMTCYLASEKAGYMTGQAINITGGREMH